MVKKTPTEYLKEPYARVVVPEEQGSYYAEILEFPGCLTSGETPEEAYRNIEEVALEWIEAELEAGREIPPPSDTEAFSGKFALRMPRSLHQQAARMAVREGTSLNQYIVTAIAARVGADDLFHRVEQKLTTYSTSQVSNIVFHPSTITYHIQTGMNFLPNTEMQFGSPLNVSSSIATTRQTQKGS